MKFVNCECVPDPFCSDGCVPWWEPCFCSVVAQCSSPPSQCLVSTWSVPVRWETHENVSIRFAIFFLLFSLQSGVFCTQPFRVISETLPPPSLLVADSFDLSDCRLMTTPSLRFRGRSPSGVDLGWLWPGSKRVETTCSVATPLSSQCSTSL